MDYFIWNMVLEQFEAKNWFLKYAVIRSMSAEHYGV